jgi:plastocyanin
MFAFEPSQIVAFEGETLRLVFVGVQGPAHRVRVGDGPILSVRRGETVETRVRAEAVGAIPFVSLDREPSMRGTIMVVPRSDR